jgi:hypothetical protein
VTSVPRVVIPSAVWDRSFRELSDHAKLVAFYIWTSPTRNSEGLSTFRLHYAATDLGMDEGHVRGALHELNQTGYVLWDVEYEAVLDVHALKWNPLRNGRDRNSGEIRPDKRIIGALRQLEDFRDSSLLPELLHVADLYSPDFADAIRARFPTIEGKVSLLKRRFQERAL